MVASVASVALKRIYDRVEPGDGVRVLVDGIWPRGVKRDEFPGKAWRPDLAPSAELRRWYGHDPDLFPEFTRRYLEELADSPAVGELLAIEGPVTLLTATRQVAISHAAVLRDHLHGLLDQR